MPEEAEHWSLTTLREKPIKIGAKAARHGHCATFQLESCKSRSQRRVLPKVWQLDRIRTPGQYQSDFKFADL